MTTKTIARRDVRARANCSEPAPHIRHLSQLDLARRWCMSPRTLERWRCTGEGPQYIRLKGRVAYREVDVEKYESERITARTR